MAKHGRNWTGIVNKHFPKRTSLSAKNRYSILQRKQELRSESQGPSTRESPSSSEPGNGAMNNGGFDLIPTTEPSYDSILHQRHRFQPTIPDYWPLTHTTAPSGCSTPDSAQAELASWSTMDIALDMNSPDPSVASYMDNSSYLSPQTPMPTHSPQPDYRMVGDFFNSMNGLGTATMHVASPGSSSYSPMYNGGMMNGVVTDPNTQYMVSSYKTW